MTERTIDLIDTYCGKCEFVKNDLDAEPCRSCIEDYNNGVTPPFFRVKKSKPMTNYERIKSMSVEEIVDFINKNYKCRKCAYYNKCCDSNCESGIKLWLEAEVSDE